MSFVQALRIRNMFPVNSDLGSAEVDLSGEDPMHEIINAYNEQMRQQEFARPRSGLEQVVSRTRGQSNNQSESNGPMKFGGVVGHQSNPGADILSRSAKTATEGYERSKLPVNEQVKGPSNDTLHMERYFARQREDKEADAKVDDAKFKRSIAQQNADSKGWKTVTITDPADPSGTKQINARINEITGEVKPITLPNNGIITRTGSAADLQKQQDMQAEKATRQQNIKDRAEASLELLNQLLDDKDELTPEGARAVGKSSIGNFIPTTPGYSGSTKIDRLKNERILDLIGEMKAQSKTGATGFGAMNLKELGVLEKAASMLDTGLDEETFKTELKRIRQLLKKASQDAPTIGTIKVFPNGKRGKWDGEGWEPIE